MLFFFAAFSGALLNTFPVQAQEVKAHRKDRIDIVIPRGSLLDALKFLEAHTRQKLAYEHSQLAAFNVPVLQFSDTRVIDIVNILLKNTNLECIIRKQLFIIRQRDPNAPDPALIKEVYLDGYVSDWRTGERIVGATVSMPQSGISVITNNFGYFSMPVRSNERMYIIVNALGYKGFDTLLTYEPKTLHIRLQAKDNVLNDIEVNASISAENIKSVEFNKVNLSPKDMQSLPRFLGEADVLKSLQLLPGIQQGNDGSAALHIRGGSPDQNLILLDGATVYNPSHVLGIFSTINPAMIKNVDLYKGDFPARYGGRTSSVLDIVTKDGNLYKLQGDYSVGFIAAQLTLEGPVQNGKTSFVLSGRRSFSDLIMSQIVYNGWNGIDKFSFYFYDFHAKLQHTFSNKDRIYFSSYSGRDKLNLATLDTSILYDQKIQMNWLWKNACASLRWNHVFSQNVFANTSFIFTDYKSSLNQSEALIIDDYALKLNYNFQSGIRDYTIKSDLSYWKSNTQAVKLGAAFTYHIFNPGLVIQDVQVKDTVNEHYMQAQQKLVGSEINAYAENEITLSEKWKTNIGLRWSGFYTEQTFYNHLQPRFNLRLLAGPGTAVKIAYSKMVQYVHLLSSNSFKLPSDLWLPVTKEVEPQMTDQYSLGFSQNAFRNKVNFSAELFYKNIYNCIELKQDQNLTFSADDKWASLITTGMGRAYGAEFMLHKKVGRINGWIAYTLSRSDRKMQGVNFAQFFPYKFDRRHDFKFVGNYTITGRLQLGLVWIYQSALPATLPQGWQETSNGYDEFGTGAGTAATVDARNNTRLDPYHRLDASIAYTLKGRNGISNTWGINVYNVYNQKNTFMYYSAFIEQTGATLNRVSLLPVVPSLSYSLKF